MSTETPQQPLTAAPPEDVWRSAMLRRFGALYVFLLHWLLRKLRLPDRSADRVRQAAAQGPIVYALHTTSQVDWLALNWVLNHHHLPLARYTYGIHTSRWAPLGVALRGWVASVRERLGGGAPDPIGSGWYADAVRDGMTTALFLVDAGDTWDLLPSDRDRPLAQDPIAALLQAQAGCARPIQVLPVTVIWSRHIDDASGLEREVLGSADDPTWLGKLFMVARVGTTALVEVGEPVSLREVLDRKAEDPLARKVKFTRLLLRRFLYRTAHVVRGPRVRPYRHTRRLVLGSREVREMVAQEASATRRDAGEIWRQASRTYDHVAARLSYRTMRLANAIVHQLWNRIYSGIDVREEDLERIRAAARSGTPILVPCHRSHLDYLLISSLLYKHQIAVPHIVAGENLSFWPAGPIARRVGAIFIKRSFKGDRVFPVIFDRYLRQLIRDGFSIEFFIEGTRSRSGKLLPAKHGVLGMVIDAAAGAREDREVTFLPIAISYEQIAEERAYAHELAGGAKKKEDLGELARASRIFGRRYGRVYLRVGEPLTVRSLLRDQGGSWEALDREHRRELLRTTGERLMYRIASQMVVLPSGLVAMALLAQARRGVRQTELLARVRRFSELVLSEGATPSATLQAGGWAVDQALRRFEGRKLVARLKDEDGDILQVIDERRITLEYYKNGILHFAVCASLLAAAVGAVCVARPGLPPPSAPDDPAVTHLFQLQILLFRYEFTLDPEVSAQALQARATAALARYGALTPDGTQVGDPALLAELAGLTRNFAESYLLVLRAARGLRSRDIPVDDLPRRIQEVGRGLLAVDELRRPEALSIENIRNAVNAFREEGVLQVKVGGGGLQFDDTAHAQYTADLNRICGRGSEAPA